MKITIKKMIEEGQFDNDILYALAKGLSYKEIILYTGLKKNYITYAINLLYKKYNAKNKMQLVILAVQKGLIDINKI